MEENENKKEDFETKEPEIPNVEESQRLISIWDPFLEKHSELINEIPDEIKQFINIKSELTKTNELIAFLKKNNDPAHKSLYYKRELEDNLVKCTKEILVFWLKKSMNPPIDKNTIRYFREDMEVCWYHAMAICKGERNYYKTFEEYINSKTNL